MTEPAALYETVRDEVGTVLVGHDELVEHLTIALLSRGHVLLEGVPGVAKTTLAQSFARASGLAYTRVQMTPDLLPADITGTSVYRSQTGEFQLQKGPIFANLVVADEINRATPKTQSALLEAMEEGHVTIEGETLALPDPFVVIATQNPIEMEGTFELPEAQRDRFLLKLTVDIPDRDEERRVLDRFNDAPELDAESVEQVVDTETLTAAREVVSDVHVADSVREYVLDLVAATRDHPDVEHGGSMRASLGLLNVAKARAAIHGREYVIPDDVKALARAVLLHRLVLTADAELSDVSPASVIDDVLADVTPPGGDSETELAAATEMADVEESATDGGSVE
ncbi:MULTISPECIES: AAA family ATPase [Halomicrobium]|nr:MULTISPECIES: MoxR family ATPase [Halomicrobium]QCD64795.1 MoxR family ATPase [Halomicrobium mukohataei]QFR19602.1 AAA domain-containing protein [Halomicrobium sp. ZPS1]